MPGRRRGDRPGVTLSTTRVENERRRPLESRSGNAELLVDRQEGGPLSDDMDVNTG
jgi:hypothetical protein